MSDTPIIRRPNAALLNAAFCMSEDPKLNVPQHEKEYVQSLVPGKEIADREYRHLIGFLAHYGSLEK